MTPHTTAHTMAADTTPHTTTIHCTRRTTLHRGDTAPTTRHHTTTEEAISTTHTTRDTTTGHTTAATPHTTHTGIMCHQPRALYRMRPSRERPCTVHTLEPERTHPCSERDDFQNSDRALHLCDATDKLTDVSKHHSEQLKQCQSYANFALTAQSCALR